MYFSWHDWQFGLPCFITVSVCNIHWCKLREIWRLRKGMQAHLDWEVFLSFNRNKTFSLKRIGNSQNLCVCVWNHPVIHLSRCSYLSRVCELILLHFNLCVQFSVLLSKLPARKRGWVMIKLLLRAYCAAVLPSVLFSFPAHVKSCVYCMSFHESIIWGCTTRTLDWLGGCVSIWCAALLVHLCCQNAKVYAKYLSCTCVVSLRKPGFKNCW